MNMRKIILGLLLFITITGFSQKNQIQVLSNVKILGKSLVDSSVIKDLNISSLIEFMKLSSIQLLDF